MPEIGTSGSMSGDGKRSVAEWPKLPRPSSTLPQQTSGPWQGTNAFGPFGTGSRVPRPRRDVISFALPAAILSTEEATEKARVHHASRRCGCHHDSSPKGLGAIGGENVPLGCAGPGPAKRGALDCLLR